MTEKGFPLPKFASSYDFRFLHRCYIRFGDRCTRHTTWRPGDSRSHGVDSTYRQAQLQCRRHYVDTISEELAAHLMHLVQEIEHDTREFTPRSVEIRDRELEVPISEVELLDDKYLEPDVPGYMPEDME